MKTDRQQIGRWALAGLIGLSCLLPLLFVPLPASHTFASFMLYLSAITGYVGLTLLLWLQVLGIRNIVARFFNDFAPVLKLHSWLGKYGLLLVFLHPIFIVLSYGESWLYPFLLNVGTQFENRVTLGRIAFYILLIIWLSSFILRSRIAYRPWKYIHYLTYLLLPFAILHVPDVGSTYIQHISAKLFVYATALLTVVTLLYRLYSWLNLDRIKFSVGNNQMIAPNIYQLTLLPVTGSLFPKLGQYIFLKLGYISEDHPFSAVQVQKDGTLTVIYKVYRSFTKELMKLEAGDTVWVNGPYGSFTSELEMNETEPTVFIAGGIGITPFLAHLLRSTNREQWLFYTNTSLEAAIYLPDLRRRLGTRVIGLFQHLDDGAEFGERAFVEPATFSRHLTKPTRYRYFVCGPPDMVNRTKQSLVSLGVAQSAIYEEAFSF
jgi:predicted ferric reductase